MAARWATSGSCLRTIKNDSALCQIKNIGCERSQFKVSSLMNGPTTRNTNNTTAVL